MNENHTSARDLPTCFVISPIGPKGSEVRKEADAVLKHLIRKSLGELYNIVRGDEDTNPGSITSRIVSSILEADLIIADLSGHNANVFYEVAIAHGYRKPIVHIEREDERPAFDLQDIRLLRFDIKDLDSMDEARMALVKFAEAAVAEPQEAKTPLSHSQQFLEYSKSENPLVKSMADMMDQLNELRADIRRARFSSEVGGSLDADRNQFAKIINNLVERGAIIPTDLKGSITLDTSERFDDWVKRVIERVIGTNDMRLVNEVALHSSITELQDSIDARVSE